MLDAKKEEIENRNIEIDKNMLKENLDIELIAKITGLSAQKIKKFKSN